MTDITPSVQLWKLVHLPDGQKELLDTQIRVHSVYEVLTNAHSYLNGETENIYFTIGECHPTPQPDDRGKFIQRSIFRQRYIPFDIDNIDPNKKLETLAVIKQVLKLKKDDGYAHFTGHGIQLYVEVGPFTKEFFTENKKLYKRVCEMIKEALVKANLPGNVDTTVFKNTALVRMPHTINVKPDKPKVKVEFLEGTLQKPDPEFSLQELAVGNLVAGPCMPENAFKKFQKMIDVEGVRQGCDFLKWCFENPDKVTEPQWYAMLGILLFLPNGEELCHEYSRRYSGYSEGETNSKIEQIRIGQTGPRFCKSVGALWNGCSSCPYRPECNQGVSSPIQIRSEDFIATSNIGFREYLIDPETLELKKKRPVALKDLMKYFEKQHPFKSIQGKRLYVYDAPVWKAYDPNYAKVFAEKNVKPEPTSHERNEVMNKIMTNNYEEIEWMNRELPKHHIAFKNGILDLKTGELHAHRPDNALFSCLPYDYIQHSCPNAQKVIERICSEDPDAVEFIWRYLGSCFDPSLRTELALFIIGAPGTGKSTLMELFRQIFPQDVSASLSIPQICNNGLFRFSAHQLHKKLVNISDEAISKLPVDSANLKRAISGGQIYFEEKGKDGFFFDARAKFVFAANKLFTLQDAASDFARKFEIFQLEDVIPEEERDKSLKDDKIPKEREGIAYVAIQYARKLIAEYEKTGYYDLKVTSKMRKTKILAVSHIDSNVSFFSRIKEVPDFHEKYLTASELYSAYKDHCHELGDKYPLQRKMFEVQFAQFLGGRKKRALFKQKRVDGCQTWVYSNLKILPLDEMGID